MGRAQATYSPPGVPLEPIKAPDKVLVIGATGHVGRVFLDQGLELFPATEFRVLLRDMEDAKHMPPTVECRPGDVRDPQSIRAACDGFTGDSLIFDSVTRIALKTTDDDGSIRAINLDGVLHVIHVAQALGVTLHKAHSSGGLPCPKKGVIDERTQASDSEEETIYRSLPYLRAKKEATRYLRRAQAEGLRVTFSYLPSPFGPASRADSLINAMMRRYVRTSTYYEAEGVELAYVDARDAAKTHWLAFMNEIYGDFILSSNATTEDFTDAIERTLGVSLKTKKLRFRTVLFIGRAGDFLRKWFFRKTAFPLSEPAAYLMFANMAYASDKAKGALGFQPRPVRDTLSDYFQDLANRRIIESTCERRPVSIW